MKFLLMFSAFLVISCNSGKRQESGENDKSENSSADNAKSRNWSNEDQVNFMEDCISEATNNMKEDSARVYCACMLTKAQSAYPKFEEVSKKMTVDQVDKWATECLGK